MTRRVWLHSALFALVTVAIVACAGAVPSSQLLNALQQRYPLSRIEVQSGPNEGTVIERGTVLRLDVEGVPAKRLRIIQANTKSPRFHVPDYARVEITEPGRITTAEGDFALPRGTEMVVLGLKVDRDRVRLFTHTAKPVPLAAGAVAFGCTEFVFRFGGETLEHADSAQVEHVIERWLPFAA